jgi:hypothetical protein
MEEERLKRSVRAFVAKFEPIIIDIHTMAFEICLGAFDEAKAQRVIAAGAEALSTANALIAAYLNIHSTDRELQDLFVQLLVSLQPRLSGELGELKAALESDPEPVDPNILDRDPASAPPGAHLIGDLAAEQDRLGHAIKTGKPDDFLPSSSSDQEAPPAAGAQSEPDDPGRAGPAASSLDPDDPRGRPLPAADPEPPSDGHAGAGGADRPGVPSPGSGETAPADEGERAHPDRSRGPADGEPTAAAQDGDDA